MNIHTHLLHACIHTHYIHVQAPTHPTMQACKDTHSTHMYGERKREREKLSQIYNSPVTTKGSSFDV